MPATKQRSQRKSTGKSSTARKSAAKRNGTFRSRSKSAKNSGGLGQGLADTVKAVGRFFSGEIEVELDSLRDLLLHELSDLYSAEHQITKALPQMAEAASSPVLKSAFRDHLHETKDQIDRLDQVFRELGEKPQRKECKAMAGLINEGNEWMGESAAPGVMDAGLIAAAQRVEHYEIAGYGCVRTYAQLLGYRSVVLLLQATLDEEGAADKKLTQLAKRINVQAQKPHKAK